MIRASNQVVRVDDFDVIKQGDTVNSFVVKLLGRDGSPKDLTGAVVTWVMANEKDVVLEKDAIVSDASNGEITLDITNSDKTGSGAMRIEIKVDNNGEIEKFPGHGYHKIHVSPSLGSDEPLPVSYSSFVSMFTQSDETWEV